MTSKTAAVLVALVLLVNPVYAATPEPTAAQPSATTAVPTIALSPTVTRTVPSYWVEYQDNGGRFSLRYPPRWAIDDQGPDYVSFQTGAYSNNALIKVVPALPFSIDTVANAFMEKRKQEGDVPELLRTGKWKLPGSFYAMVRISYPGFDIEDLMVVSPVDSTSTILAAITNVAPSSIGHATAVSEEDEEQFAHVLLSVKVNEAAAPTSITPTPTQSGQIRLDGQGQQASSFFNLRSGLAIFRMTHAGEHNFAIWLLDDHGKKIDLLVNELGSFAGSKAIGIEKAGRYLLNVQADGKWTVSIEQEN